MLVLAVPGVILTTLIIGGVIAWATPLSLPVALVFGALIAATPGGPFRLTPRPY